MLRSSSIPRILLAAVILALLIMAFGAYQFVSASQRFDELAAVPIPSDLNRTDQAQALMLAQLALDKKNAELARGGAILIIGVGVVLLGAAGFIYSRVPDSPPAATPRETTGRVQP